MHRHYAIDRSDKQKSAQDRFLDASRKTWLALRLALLVQHIRQAIQRVIEAFLLLQHRIDKPIVPSFKFLRGRGQMVKAKGTTEARDYRRIRYACSFEADYNDVCAAADKELTALGYVQTPFAGQPSYRRIYELQGPRIGDSIIVMILMEHQLKQNTIPLFATYYKDGYVVVEINRMQRQSWLIYRIKYWSKRLFP